MVLLPALVVAVDLGPGLRGADAVLLRHALHPVLHVRHHKDGHQPLLPAEELLRAAPYDDEGLPGGRLFPQQVKLHLHQDLVDGVGQPLHPPGQQGVALGLVVLFQKLGGDIVLLRQLVQDAPVVVGDAQVVGDFVGHIVAAAAVLTANGDDHLLIHTIPLFLTCNSAGRSWPWRWPPRSPWRARRSCSRWASR